LLPDSVNVFASTASNHRANPGRLSGLNRGFCEDVPTIDIFAYRSRIVLDVSRETTSVCVLLLGMMSGLVRFNVFVSVIVSWEEVALRRDQKLPPSNLFTTDGRESALKPEFVR
jgi:hypothetical protein